MPAITRVGVDKSAGHYYPPRAPSSGGQSTIFINNILATVIGAEYPSHTYGASTHDGVASAGSSTVFIEGKSVHRIGDNISCGDVSAAGSSNVFAGG